MTCPYLAPRRVLVLGSILVGGLAFLAAVRLLVTPTSPSVVINGTAAPPLPTLDAARLDLGARVYAEECAGCHGARLEGAPNWKEPGPDGALPPPPHDATGHTWHHPDSLLLDIITHGGDPAYGSKMPAFGDRLTSQEMAAALEYIKDSWGHEEREFQWWITAQAGR